MNDLWLRFHGVVRPDRPRAANAVALTRALGFEVHRADRLDTEDLAGSGFPRRGRDRARAQASVPRRRPRRRDRRGPRVSARRTRRTVDGRSARARRSSRCGGTSRPAPISNPTPRPRYHRAHGAVGPLTAVGPLDVDRRRGPVDGRQPEPERHDGVDEAAQLLRPVRTTPRLLEPEPQLAVAPPPDGPNVDAFGLHLGGGLCASGSPLIAAAPRRRRNVGRRDAEVDAPARRAPATDEQIVIGAGVDANEPRSTAGLLARGLTGRCRARALVRPRPDLRPRGEGVRVGGDEGAHSGTRDEDEHPNQDPREPSHGATLPWPERAYRERRATPSRSTNSPTRASSIRNTRPS